MIYLSVCIFFCDKYSFNVKLPVYFVHFKMCITLNQKDVYADQGLRNKINLF